MRRIARHAAAVIALIVAVSGCTSTHHGLSDRASGVCASFLVQEKRQRPKGGLLAIIPISTIKTTNSNIEGLAGFLATLSSSGSLVLCAIHGVATSFNCGGRSAQFLITLDGRQRFTMPCDATRPIT